MSFFKTTSSKTKQEGEAKAENKEVHKEKISNEMYYYIHFKCFDACVGNFENKIVDNHEKSCVEECVTNLKEAPLNFENSH